MKKIITFLIILIIVSDLCAQAPEKMSYQAVIRDANGQLIKNTNIGIQVKIQKYIIGMPPTHENVYVETFSELSTNENGLLTFSIGTGQIVLGNFEDIDWSDGTYILKSEIDPEGGTNYNIISSSQIMSVPYALYAKNAKTYKVGDFAQGGIVFWIDESGQHGLVCAKEDQSSNIRWYAGNYGSTRATGDGPYSGELNTAIIISSLINFGDDGLDYAAQLCNDLVVSEGDISYGDWYLPSLEELTLMWQNRAIIDLTAVTNGGSSFENSPYWSSTEVGYAHAAVFRFEEGISQNVWKEFETNVRAIRAF